MDLPLHLPATTIYTGVPYLLADSGLAVILRGKHVGRGTLTARLDRPAAGMLRAAMALLSSGTHMRMEVTVPVDTDGERLLWVESWTDHGNPVDMPRKKPGKKPRIEYPRIELRLYRVGRIDPA